MWEAIEACSAVLPHISKDDVTPVITCAQIQGNAIRATDRFTVAEHELSESLDDGTLMIPRDAVNWIARIVTKHLLHHPTAGGYTVTIRGNDPDIYAGTLDPHEPNLPEGEFATRTEARGGILHEFRESPIRVTVDSRDGGTEAMRAFRPIHGTFPPVGRLLTEFKPSADVAEVALGPVHLEKFTTWARKWHREQPLRFELSAREGGGGKPGPIRVTYGKFRGLIQPNLLLK